MINRGVPRRMRPPPMIIYPNPVSTISGGSRANLPAGILIISVVTTALANADRKL
jgi:hypothetical protein